MSLRSVPIAMRLMILGGVGVLAASAIGVAALVEASLVSQAQTSAAAMAALNLDVTRLDVEHANSQIASRDALLAKSDADLAEAQSEQKDASDTMAGIWAHAEQLDAPADIAAARDDLH